MTQQPVGPEAIMRRGWYRYSWSSLNLVAQLDHFSERDGVHCEIVWEFNGRHLLRHQQNLISLTTKTSLVKRLRDLRSDDTWTQGWDQVVEYVCERSLQHFRQGEPMVQIGNKPVAPTRKWRLYPIMPEGMPALLYGKGGSGKSLLGYLMGIMVQLGLPMFGWQPIQGNVGILDWETSDDEVNERLQQLQAGLRLEGDPILWYKHCFRPFVEMMPELMRDVVDHNLEVLIIDSVIPALGGPSEKSEIVNPLFDCLRELAVTPLLISHVAKAEVAAGNSKTPYGNVFFENRARNQFWVRGAQEEGSAVLQTALFHTKANLIGKRRPSAFEFTFQETGEITVVSKDVRDIPDLMATQPLPQRIEGTLRDGAKTVQELAELLEVEVKSISPRLSEMLKRGRVTKVEGAKWGLPSNLPTYNL